MYRSLILLQYIVYNVSGFPCHLVSSLDGSGSVRLDCTSIYLKTILKYITTKTSTVIITITTLGEPSAKDGLHGYRRRGEHGDISTGTNDVTLQCR